MSVPVSQYEALRAEMRTLVQNAQHLQEIATHVISATSACVQVKMSSHIDNATTIPESSNQQATIMSVSSDPLVVIPNKSKNLLLHGTWPIEKGGGAWNEDDSSSSSNTNGQLAQDYNNVPYSSQNMDQGSVLSFASSGGGANLECVLDSERLSRRSMQQLEAKVDMVYSLLAMLGGQEHADMGDTLLALSANSESCLAMRQSGCIPLLVQLVQSDKDLETRRKASMALNNLVHAQPDEKLRKREIRVLKLLETTRLYIDALAHHLEKQFNVTTATTVSSSSSSTSTNVSQDNTPDGEDDTHPVSTVANLMKHSFDEGHRQAMCQLGGIQIIASIVEVEHVRHGSTDLTSNCILLRRYACMALTNLTFGDSGNKALLCSLKDFMRALVIQLQSASDELRQVTASVLRNLSWRADQTSKEILREVGTVNGLMKAGMATLKENTLKSILSALWNLSAHCTENKLEICAIENGLAFLVDMLCYKAPSKSLTINENAGGILRNISSQIAIREDYRDVLRCHNCLQILLTQLKSPSLTIVSNACGTLWNLSAKNKMDQELLWQMGAPAMLRSLNHSKHKMIATGSSAALKNLLNSRPSHDAYMQVVDSTARTLDLPVLPTLGARKQKALMRDLDLVDLNDLVVDVEEEEEEDVQQVTTQPSTSKKEAAIPVLRSPSSETDETNDENLIDNDQCKRNLLLDEKDRCSIDDNNETNDSFVSTKMSTPIQKTAPSISSKSSMKLKYASSTSSSNAPIQRTVGSSGIPLPKSLANTAALMKHRNAETSLDDIKLNIDAKMIDKSIRKLTKFDRPIGVATKHYNMKKTMEQQQQSVMNETRKEVNMKNSDLKSPRIIDAVLLDDAAAATEAADSCLVKNVDNRMLDPDAMIESLDRFTAELVSQASSHFQSKINQSVTSSQSVDGSDTWNSPNDVTFPSISDPMPHIITFDSDKEDDVQEGEGEKDFKSLDSTTTTTTMTESTLVALEASKLASTLKRQASCDLDAMQPPSAMNSLTNSDILSSSLTASPKALRKTSLTTGLLLRRTFNNHKQQELETNDLSVISNLDQINPPSTLGDVLELDSSLTGCQSLPFYEVAATATTTTTIDNVNPPTLFHDVTDLCNSLADATTDIYEDCETLRDTENVFPHDGDVDDDLTEFSDANSNTPQTEPSSSAETTPAKQKLTAKEKRSSKKDRFKTYIVSSDAFNEHMQQQQQQNDDFSLTDDFRTLKDDFSDNSYKTAAETYNIKSDEAGCSTITKEKSSPKLSLRKRSFLQRRLENADRFKTQIIDANLALSSNDIQLLVEQEANIVLKQLNATKPHELQLLDSETVSLVSNDDDTENSSSHSIYKTYHKSWNKSKSDIPIISKDGDVEVTEVEVTEAEKTSSKPKIVKPSSINHRYSDLVTRSDDENEQATSGGGGGGKGIRGRRKPLYSKTNASVVSSKLPNRTTTITKVGCVNKSPTHLINKQAPSMLKKPMTTTTTTTTIKSRLQSPKSSPIRSSTTIGLTTTRLTARNAAVPANGTPSIVGPAVLERQNTFTKDDSSKATPKTRIPFARPPLNNNNNAKQQQHTTSNSRIPAAGKAIGGAVQRPSRSTSIPMAAAATATTTTTTTTPSIQQRSASADPTSHKSSPNTNTKLKQTTNNQVAAANKITSRIASLWKKVEENKLKQNHQQQQQRVWIQQREDLVVTVGNADETAIAP